MKNPQLQLLVYGENIAQSQVSLRHPGVHLQQVIQVQNPNYLFLNLHLSPEAAVGKFAINFQIGKKTLQYEYELRPRVAATGRYQGFNAADVMYLLMPDRFANGNPQNDEMTGMREGLNRKDEYGRHGGDLQGIHQNLDYFTKLGVTALWLNPVQENDMPSQSYHGYAFTDFYKVDARLGSNEDYAQLVAACHQKGLKVIMDLVANHCGTHHWFVKDPPMEDWIHQFPEFTRSNYRGVTQVDPYRSQADFNLMLKGWFDTTMADLNQQNPFLATYLIQNSIWWIEYTGLDGIRMDTYSYPYKEFLAQWAQAIQTEYPGFGLVGEVWEYLVSTQVHWQAGYGQSQGKYESYLPSVTDFVMQQAFGRAFNESDGWDTGISRLYYTLTQDRVYPQPLQLLTFLDNHDVERFFTTVGQNVDRFKMALVALLTLRGVPQIYYGTELALTGKSNGEVRPEFPGGWPDHSQNVFNNANLSPLQTEVFQYLQTLLQWRKNQPAIHQGKMMHFVPQDNVYVYFRYTDSQTVMVIMNNADQARNLTTRRFAERMAGFTRAQDALSQEMISDLQTIPLAPRSARVLTLIK
ncbi:MAG: glycoside hydrolase family 13 protein [Microscillaceae bacterium]